MHSSKKTIADNVLDQHPAEARCRFTITRRLLVEDASATLPVGCGTTWRCLAGALMEQRLDAPAGGIPPGRTYNREAVNMKAAKRRLFFSMAAKGLFVSDGPLSDIAPYDRYWRIFARS